MNGLGIRYLLCVLCLCLGACTTELPGDSQIGTAVSGTLTAVLPKADVAPTPGDAPENPAAIPAPGIVNLIDSYLVETIGGAYAGGRAFCAYELMDSVHDEHQQQTTLYLWVLCQEYLAVGDRLEVGSGVSVPVELFV